MTLLSIWALGAGLVIASPALASPAVASCRSADTTSERLRSCVTLSAVPHCSAGQCSYFVDARNQCDVRVWVKLDQPSSREMASASVGPGQATTLEIRADATSDIAYRWNVLAFCEAGNVVRH